MKLPILKIGKKYRGRHITNNLNDGYLGSGTRLKMAIDKYGFDNFKNIILFHAFDYDSLLWAEKVLVDNDWVEREDTYNITIGGGGSYTKFVNGSWVNVMQIESVKQKRRKTLFERYPNGINVFSSENNPMKDKKNIEKMVETRRNHPLGYHHGRLPFVLSDKQKEKNRDRMLNNNPMNNDIIKQRKKDKTARKYGFSDDQQFTNYIKDLYEIMAMTPILITKVIGCDKSTVERRCIWVHQ